MKNNFSKGIGPAFGGKNYDIKRLIEWLSFVLKCPICNAKYNLGKTKILESEQNEVLNEARILIHSDCVKCKSSVMFNVEIKGPEVFSVGMVTDLTGTDSAKFNTKRPIHVNEVIGIHEALKNFKGNIIEAISGK